MVALGKNFPHSIPAAGPSTWGLGNLVPVPGNIYFVDQLRGSDSNRGDKPTRALATLSKAHTLMTANQNDVAVVIGSTTGTNANASGGSSIAVREAATLAWSKDQCHIIGLSYNHMAQRVSIRSDGTEFTPLVNVTADGCVFANLHAFHGYNAAADQICWQESGQRNAHFNLHIAGMAHTTTATRAGSRSLKLSGDGERLFKNCVIGLDTVARTGSAEIEFDAAAVRDWFEDCTVLTYTTAGQTNNHHVRAAGSGDIDRFIMFKNCMFLNSGEDAAGGTQAEAFDVHASVGGTFVLWGSSLFGATDWETSASGNVQISSYPVPAADMGLGNDVAPS